jgi:hypothetical protein
MKTKIEITTRERGKKKTIPKGSEVTIISISGEVAIAEYNGIRFPIRKEHLQ